MYSAKFVPPQLVDRGDAVCVIGAGPAGLSIARALKGAKVPFDHFERHSDVGGLWDPANPGSPIYESAHFISSRDMSGFFDFPMPKSFADYPSHRDILRYTRFFADAFGVRQGIRFGAEIVSVEEHQDRWRVELAGGEAYLYRAVVCANGVNWHPRMPTWPGTFDGEIRHSVSHRSGQDFRGKRVLIVGLGNSGADIACDAATHAEAAFVSIRRGYHFIPKHLFGIPADEFASTSQGWPIWLKRSIFSLILKMLVGDLTRWGLPRPDHKLFATHPLMTSQLIHHLQHGNVSVCADIRRLDGREVEFVDGRREVVDVILCATGYDMRIPFLHERYFDWAGGRPQLYMTAFNRRHKNLFGLGHLETNSSAYTLFDHISHLVAHYLSDQMRHTDRAEAFERLMQSHQTDLSGGIHFVDSPRHKAYVEIDTYKRAAEKLRKKMGWPALQPGFFDAIRDPLVVFKEGAPASSSLHFPPAMSHGLLTQTIGVPK